MTMPTDNSLIIIVEFAILMVAISISKTQTKKAIALLTHKQKEKVRSVTGNSINQLIPVLIMVILFFMVKSYFPEDQTMLGIGFAGVLFSYLVISGFLLFRKLSKAGLPKKFNKAYLQATMIMYVGAGVFCYLAVTNPL